MDSLFANTEFPHHEHTDTTMSPLADRMRPRTLGDIIGQEHLVGSHAPLRKMAEGGWLRSLILWGPPGSGKTTLAHVLAHEVGYHFIRISAVEAGVKEVREAIGLAQKAVRKGSKTILFIDEIHRFTKSQQDALLHAVERGFIILIGATTENPSFEVNSALLSRCQVYRLQPLTDDHLRGVIAHAIAHDTVLSSHSIHFDAWTTLFAISGGDARSALNALELSLSFAEKKEDGTLHITDEIMAAALQQKTARYDKQGEQHYDVISAFIKTLRGSDPDAALLWLARMLDAGEDPLFIARRMVIFASEDIGNANPQALQVAVSVYQAVHFLGMPECRITLAHGVTYLAASPKSNSSYMAIEKALDIIRSGEQAIVPLHLRNAPTRLMKKEGYGKEYQYPHDNPDHFIEEHYFPVGMQETVLYIPSDSGFEKNIGDRLRHLWKQRYTEEKK